MTRAGVLTTIVAVGLTITAIAAQQPQAPAAGAPQGEGRGRGGGGGRIPPTGMIKKVRDNLYVIPGAGGNTTVFVRQDGVVLVDTKLANNGEAILNQVRSVTDKPVTMIINTHHHPDHMGSNGYFPPTVEKVSHENARTRMAMNAQYATNPAIMPTRSFANSMTLGDGKDRIDLYYFGRGHTDGDAFVVFRALRAMCIGDLMAWKMGPLIDGNAGGSILALVDTLHKAEKGIKNVDTVIEGHGDVNTWQGMKDYTDFMAAIVDAAREGQGKKTAEQIAMELKPKFPVFTKDELLPGLEYGGTPWSRTPLMVTVALEELAGRVGPVR